MKHSIFEASEALQKWEGLVLKKTKTFHWFSCNSEVEATWTSLNGGPYRTSNNNAHNICSRSFNLKRLLKFIAQFHFFLFLTQKREHKFSVEQVYGTDVPVGWKDCAWSWKTPLIHLHRGDWYDHGCTYIFKHINPIQTRGRQILPTIAEVAKKIPSDTSMHRLFTLKENKILEVFPLLS